MRVETPHDVVCTCCTRLVARLELDVEAPREVLPQIVRRARLQRPAVPHQRLDRVGAIGAGELLALGLLAVHHGHRQVVLGEVLVDAEHPHRLFLRLLRRLVRGVPLLPEELGRPQEQPRDLLPAHDVRPLVDQDREIAPGLDPLRVHRADDRLGGRADDEPLLEHLVAALRHPRDLRREALDVLRLPHQEALGNEEREVRVDVPGRLEAAVEPLLHQLPDRVAVGPDHHAALDGRVVGQLRAPHDVDVPAAEVLRLRRDLGWEVGNLSVFGHVRLTGSGYRLRAPESVVRSPEPGARTSETCVRQCRSITRKSPRTPTVLSYQSALEH